jgi:AraC-like DNA-binding protein
MPNAVKIWRAADLGGAELLKAKYLRHIYPPHSHETVSLGLVTRGAVELRTRRKTGIAEQGSFVLINSEEIHEGWSADPKGWECRTLHVMPHMIQSTLEEFRVFTKPKPAVFCGPTIEDADLATAFLELHLCSETEGSSLERQSQTVMLISRLLRLYTEARIEPAMGVREPNAVRRARAYLDENLSEKVTLVELAREADLTPFRLLRAFRATVGVSPHDYQLQARVRVATQMLRRKVPLVSAAHALGFSDQAHLTRVFKSIMGSTPGQFRTAELHR